MLLSLLSLLLLSLLLLLLLTGTITRRVFLLRGMYVIDVSSSLLTAARCAYYG
jgi:hypothetical protein